MVEFQWRLGNCVTSKQDCLGCNAGIEIVSTGNNDFLSSNEGMEMLLPGKQTVWVAMRTWKSCQQETNTFWFPIKARNSCQEEQGLFGFQWRHGNPVNRRTTCLVFNECMEILSILFRFQSRQGNLAKRKITSVWVPMRTWKLCHPEKILVGLQWRHGNPVNRKQILFEFQWRHGNPVKRTKGCLGFNEGMQILPTGKTIVWVLMKASKSCQYSFGFSQEMEVLWRGKTKKMSYNEGM